MRRGRATRRALGVSHSRVAHESEGPMSAATPPRPAVPPEPPSAVRTPRDPYAAPAPVAPAPVAPAPVPPVAGAPLPPPEDPRWWEGSWWPALLAGIVGLIVGGLVGAALAEPERT